MTVAAPPAAPQAPLPPRKPRKIFLVVGLVIAVGLGIGLFTSIGTPKKSGVPQAGDPVPSFTAARVNGSGTVDVRATGGSVGDTESASAGTADATGGEAAGEGGEVSRIADFAGA